MPADIEKFKRLRERLKRAVAAGARVKVGVLASAGQHGSDAVGMVELAAIHEYGSPVAGIPERSFLRRTLELKREEIVEVTEKIAKKFLENELTLAQALGLLGQFVVGQVRLTITSQQVVPRLSESEAGRRTIARKGSSVTLVDHGLLLNSISYEVVGVED